MITCTKRYSEIPFAHRAPFHDGHCRFVHGHGWSFEFEFVADSLDANGFVIDFGGLKELKAELDKLDHAFVVSADDPELFPFRSRPDLYQLVIVPCASSEGLAEHFFHTANRVLAGTYFQTRGARCIRCTVFEDSRNSATFRE